LARFAWPRHAAYYRRWLEQTGTEWATLSTGADRSPHFAALNNVRAALKWCFDVDGDPEIAVPLAAAAVPVFSAMLAARKAAKKAAEAAAPAVAKPKHAPAPAPPTETPPTPEQLRDRVRAALLRRRPRG
jgi:predicted ATPase